MQYCNVGQYPSYYTSCQHLSAIICMQTPHINNPDSIFLIIVSLSHNTVFCISLHIHCKSFSFLNNSFTSSFIFFIPPPRQPITTGMIYDSFYPFQARHISFEWSRHGEFLKKKWRSCHMHFK